MRFACRMRMNRARMHTTRESARLSPQTGAFNLRSSSDAPNLQVENEETIEALSARTKALLERSNSAFILPFAFQHPARDLPRPAAIRIVIVALHHRTKRTAFPPFPFPAPSRQCGPRRGNACVLLPPRAALHATIGVFSRCTNRFRSPDRPATTTTLSNEASGDPQ